MSHNPLKGTIIVISDYGVGKTEFALGSTEKLSNVIFLADDKEPLVDHKEFKLYFNLSKELRGLTLLQMHERCLELIEKLPEAEVIIWDTWTRFEKTFIEYVQANKGQFRNKYSGTGEIVGALQWQDAKNYEASIINLLQSKCDRLILTFHVKQRYETIGSKRIAVPGAVQPGHLDVIDRVSHLRLWLTPNPDSQIPIGLVLKNISKRTDGKPQRVLPKRLDKCDWTNILRYYNQPIGDRLPNTTEKPTEFELSLIEGFLTEEQKRLFEVALENTKENNPDEEIIARARELSGLPGKIAGILSDEFSREVSIADVVEWRNGA